MQQKTVIITLAEAAVARNVLRTDFWSTLRTRNDVRIVLVTTPELLARYTEEFADKEVIVTALQTSEPSLFERVLAFLARNGFVTKTSMLMQHRAYEQGETHIPSWIKFCLGFVMRLPPLRAIVRALELCIAPSAEVATLFDSYEPALVFSAVLTDPSLDVPILRQARRLNIATVGMVRSWDNLTTYGFIRIIPDRFLAQNDFLRDMAITLHDVPKNAITVVGTPAFDIYEKPELLISREEYCAQMGIDPHKKIILYAAIGDFLFPKEGEMADVFEYCITKGMIEKDYVVIFRPHPAFKSSIDHVRNMRYVVGDITDRDDNIRDTVTVRKNHAAHLVNSIHHAALVVTAGSTMMIEGALLHKPVITVAFDGLSQVPYWFSIARFHDHATHIIALLKTGGVRVAYSSEELARLVQKYLDDPTRDATNREALVERFAGPPHAGKRMATALLGILKP